MPSEIQLQDVPPGRGFVWLRQGARVFAHRPVAFCLLLSSALFCLFLVASVPVIGPLISQAALPIVWLGFMIASQITLRGQVPLPDVFIVPLRMDRARTITLLQLCLLYAVGLEATAFFTEWLSDGSFEAMRELMARPNPTQAQAQAVLSNPALSRAAFTGTALLALLSVPFWFAMALVHWGGHSIGKSLFFSTVAVWRAKWAFAVHGLTCVAALIGLSTIASLVLALIGRPDWAPAVVMPVTLLFFSVFLASLFFTFVDAFVSTPGVPPAPPEAPEPPSDAPPAQPPANDQP